MFPGRLARVPAETVPLLVIYFLEQGQCAAAPIMRTHNEQDMKQAHRGGIGIAERRFDRGHKALMGESCNRRNKGIGDAYAISTVGAGLLHSLDRLTQTAPEADRDH